MRATNLEDIVPGLREARDRERRNRALAFCDVPWTVCGQQCVVLTPRHRLELQLVGNAFATNQKVDRAHLLQFLWRLNPRFRKPLWFGSPAWLARRRLVRAVARLDVDRGAAEVWAYLAAMLQDLPETGDARDTINPPEIYVHWLAGEMNFYLTRYAGFTQAVLMDTSYLVLQQLYRAHRLASEEHPNFINESDRLIGRWRRAILTSREKAN